MRRGSPLLVSKKTSKMAAILELLIDRHEAGYAVIMGAEEFPSVEDFRILKFAEGGADPDVRVQHDRKMYEQERYYMQFETAEKLVAFVQEQGGAARIAEAARAYKRENPQDMRILSELGSRGFHRTMEDIANRYFMDVKALRRRKENILRRLAYDTTHDVRNYELEAM